MTQGPRGGPARRPPERTAYPLILAALQESGPDAEADYDALAEALPQYTRHTIATRCGELVRLGRLAPGEREGTVRLPS